MEVLLWEEELGPVREVGVAARAVNQQVKGLLHAVKDDHIILFL